MEGIVKKRVFCRYMKNFVIGLSKRVINQIRPNILLHTLIIFILWVSAVSWTNENQSLLEIDEAKPKLNRTVRIAFTRRKPLNSLDSFRATMEPE